MGLSDKDIGELDPQKAKFLLELWIVRAHRAANAHFWQASDHKYKAMVLTLINVVAAILVLYFSNSSWIEAFINGAEEGGANSKYSIVAGVFALVVVITTIFQYMKRWDERSDNHKLAGSEFSNFQRKAERYALAKEVNMQMIHNLNRDYNNVMKNSPLVHKDIWKKTAANEHGDRIKHLERCLRNADPDYTYDPNKKD